PPLARLGASWPLWSLLPALVAALAVGLPAAILARWLARGGAAASDLPRLAAAFGNTAIYAVLGALIVCIVSLPIAWLSARRPGRLQRLLESAHIYVGALPAVIVVLALVAI